MVSAERVRELCPLLEVDDVIAGSLSLTDGHAIPEAAVHGYASGARALGVRIQTGCDLLDIETGGGEITAIVTSRGTGACDKVICTAGVWSPACAEMVGVELPVRPVRRQTCSPSRLPTYRRSCR